MALDFILVYRNFFYGITLWSREQNLDMYTWVGVVK